MIWDESTLKKVVEPVPGKVLSELDPKKNLVHAYKKHLITLPLNKEIELCRLFLQVFWERYPTPAIALDAPADVIYEVLYAMQLGNTPKTAEKNSALLNSLKHLAKKGRGNWVHYLILSELIVSDKNLAPEIDDAAFAKQLHDLYDKKSIEIDLKNKARVAALKQAENERLALINNEKRRAKEERREKAALAAAAKEAEKKGKERIKRNERKLRKAAALQTQEQQNPLPEAQKNEERKEILQPTQQTSSPIFQIKSKPSPSSIPIDQAAIAKQPTTKERLVYFKNLSFDLLCLFSIGALSEYVLAKKTSLSPTASSVASLGIVSTISLSLYAYDWNNQRKKWNAFYETKKNFENSSDWDVNQFTTLIQAYRAVKKPNIELFSGENSKILFLKKVLHIYNILNQYATCDLLQDNGSEILKVFAHNHKNSKEDTQGLKNAATQHILFLTEDFTLDTEKYSSPRYVRINNYLVSGAELKTHAERAFVDNFKKEMKDVNVSHKLSDLYIKLYNFSLNATQHDFKANAKLKN